jgi:3-oxoacyl-[acyl-carrier protein] reductase
MTNKTIIVSGASKGIGFQVCRIAAEMGNTVYAVTRNVKPLNSIKGVNTVKLDITNESDIENFTKHIKNSKIKIDSLINNAGLLSNTPFKDSDTSVFEAIYKVNVFGLASLTRNLLPFINKKGHVVNISSMGGLERSSKFSGLSVYSSSKSAVNNLTELLAEEYKSTGPSFNSLAIGAVQTEMLEKAFPGIKASLNSSEMADYILNFALNGQQYFNGKIIPVSSSTP